MLYKLYMLFKQWDYSFRTVCEWTEMWLCPSDLVPVDGFFSSFLSILDNISGLLALRVK